MDRNIYVDTVLSFLRDLTAAERAAVRAEIDGHIEDRMLALQEQGADSESAERRAIEVMGDPEEVGRELQKQYPLYSLVALRGVTIALTLALLCTLLLSFPGYHIYNHLQAHFFPKSHLGGSHVEWCTQELEIRTDVGSDQLYIYGAGTDPEEGIARVYCAVYDRNPLGYVSQWGMHFETENGEELPGGGGSSSTAASSYWNYKFDVPVGTECIYAVIDRYGEAQRLEVPLRWEVTS